MKHDSKPHRLLHGGLAARLCAIAIPLAGCSDTSQTDPPSRVSPASQTRQAGPAVAAHPGEGAVELTSEEKALKAKLLESCQAGLEELARNPLVVASVIEANHANTETQEEILAKDVKWRHANGAADPLIAPYLSNACAEELKRVQVLHPEYAELFVMDDKGCIVGESNKTSDYWQGDEPKWIRSFNGGNGQLFVDEIEYDQSTQRYVIQISLPVFDAEKRTVGALTVSVLARTGT